jgi:hypothetical protein
VVWDGAKLVTLEDGKEVYRYVPPAPIAYLAPPPLVADLSGKRRILVRDSAGNQLLCSAEGKKERVFLEKPYEVPELVADPTGAALEPLVCDIDGDGENEVVAVVTDRQGRPACVILDGDGQEKRRLGLPPGMTALNRGPTGRLGPGLGRWLLLRMSGEGPDHERRNLVAAYDGRTGKQLWARDHYGFYGKRPVTFVAHFPSAVLDYDGDGADDWLACSENFYGIISVKENKDLVGPVVLSDALAGHWTAYTFPSVATLQADGKPVVFHHNAYALVPSGVAVGDRCEGRADAGDLVFRRRAPSPRHSLRIPEDRLRTPPGRRPSITHPAARCVRSSRPASPAPRSSGTTSSCTAPPLPSC